MTGETWTIGDLARLSGVTSRTLRHYDAIGLLAPVDVGAGGRRLYGREELLRLQQILVLRELDVDLPTVARVLAADGEHGARAELLREHHARLVAERDRFDRLAATVASTLESLEGGHDMAAKDLYAGFDNSQYDAEARERWGTEAVDRSNDAWARLGADGQAAHHRESEAIGEGLAACLADGLPPDDERTQGLVGRHFAQIATFWTPNRESYPGLGQLYAEAPDFRVQFDAVDPGLADYMRDAMTWYAEARLA